MTLYWLAVPSMRPMSVKNRKVNYVPLLTRSLPGAPYVKNQSLVKAVAKSCAATVCNGTVMVSFGKRSDIAGNAESLLFDVINGPRLSILTYDNGSVAGNVISSVA